MEELDSVATGKESTDEVSFSSDQISEESADASKADEEHIAKPIDEFDERLQRLCNRFLRHEARLEEIAEAEKAKEALEAVDIIHSGPLQLSSAAEEILEKSNQTLMKIQHDGSEFVSNIFAVANLHESKRLFDAEVLQKKREEDLMQSNQKFQQEFEKVMEKWETMKDEKVPQKLYQLYQNLKTECNAILNEKDEIIANLNQKLKENEREYVQTIKQQEEDTVLASERINQLIKDLRKASKDELSHIRDVLDDNTAELVALRMQEYGERHMESSECEKKYIGELEKAAEKHAEELINTKVLQTEEMAALRTQIEDDIHNLDLQLQKMKAIFLLNQDKLEYGFQVLHKRHEEAIRAIFELKRTYAHHFDHSIQLKMKLERINKEGKEQQQLLKSEAKRIFDQIPGVTKSANFFHGLDAKRFSSVFQAQKAEARKLVEEVAELDRVICETILHVPWEPIDMSFLEKKAPFEDGENIDEYFVEDGVSHSVSGNEGPLFTVSTPRSTPESDYEVVEQRFSQAIDIEELMKKLTLEKEMENKIVQPQQLKKLLDFICKEMNFLVEERVLQLLEPLEPSEQTFMILDAILRVLGINNIDNATELIAYMINRSKKSETSDDIYISSKDILEAFKEYLDAQKSKRETGSVVHSTSSIQFKECHDFWKPYKDILPKHREVVWDNLAIALKKHYFTVRKRAQLLQERRELMLQNKELGGLVYHYMGQSD